MTSTPTVVVLDYGSGNLRSAERALARTGARVRLTDDYDAALKADGLVVPGVGAFAACMEGLIDAGGRELFTERIMAGGPILGICVGHQVLFETGIEHGEATAGFGIWPGVVEQLQARPLPHMGWNVVEPPEESAMFSGVETDRFYFVHSYAVRNLAPSAGRLRTFSEHGGDRFVAAVEDGIVWSTQFHPEKSGDAGARLLTNWVATL